MLNQQTMTLTNWLFRAPDIKKWNRLATPRESLSSSGQFNSFPSVQELAFKSRVANQTDHSDIIEEFILRMT